MSIASCGKTVKEIEYVDRVVYQTPLMVKPVDTEYPDVEIRINGDLIRYQRVCEAQIDMCNIDKRTMYVGE